MPRPDTETNPGPRKSYPINFCHWSLNGLAVHNFIKAPLIKAFISTHNLNILCLSETFLDSRMDLNDGNIIINGYVIPRASKSKCGSFVHILIFTINQKR